MNDRKIYLNIYLMNILLSLSLARVTELPVSIDNETNSGNSIPSMEVSNYQVKAFLSSARSQKCHGECLKKVTWFQPISSDFRQFCFQNSKVKRPRTLFKIPGVYVRGLVNVKCKILFIWVAFEYSNSVFMKTLSKKILFKIDKTVQFESRRLEEKRIDHFSIHSE